jgi:hypothetical protein
MAGPLGLYEYLGGLVPGPKGPGWMNAWPFGP